LYPESLLSHNWLIKRLINSRVRTRLPALSGIVLDLGCGVRPFEQDIRIYAADYYGIDWSQSLHGLYPDVIANLNHSLPIADGTIDHIVSFEVLEHLSEPTMMLAEAHRVLRTGGEITLSTPFQWWVHEAPWDYYRYTCHGIRYILERAGFKDIAIAPISGFWSMWVLKLNYQLARLVRGPRTVRIAVRAFLIPFWWLGQTIAPILDHYWPEDRETAGYFVTACKP
jgi:SAM-dependent methyltransferase